MIDVLNSNSLATPDADSIPVFAQKALDRCHIVFPDCTQPIGAIFYESNYYAYVKFFPSTTKAQEVARRLINRGKKVILTRVRKGIVLWVHEPEAQPAK